MYCKQWLQDLPIGTQLVCGDEPCYIYTINKKPNKTKRVQRYADIPFSRDIVRIYWDDQEQQCRLAYQDPNHDFPLSGRLKGIILPDSA